MNLEYINTNDTLNPKIKIIEDSPLYLLVNLIIEAMVFDDVLIISKDCLKN